MNQKIKISQLPAKGSNLAADDLIEVAEFTGTGYVSKSITGQEIIDAIPVPPSGITIGTTAITSGTVGRVLFEGTGNVVQQSSSLFWDATNNRLGIGTSTPSFVIDVIGNVNGILRPHVKNLSNGVNAQSAILLRNDVDTQYMFGVVSTQYNTSNIIQNDAYVQHNDINNSYPTSGLVLRTSNINPLKFQTNATERLRIHGNTGNVLINTTTDAGFRLDVNGTARVQGQLSLGLTGTAGRVNFARASNGTMIGAIYTSNNDIIIENQSQGIIFMAVGAEAARFSNTTRNLLINTTTDAGFRLDVNGTARVSQDLTLVAGNAIRFGTSLGMSKTANQMLIYGGTGAGNAGGTDVHYWNGSTYVVGLRLNNNANVLIGTTTDGGSKLRVVGLPTSSAGLSSGDVWNDAGTLKIV